MFIFQRIDEMTEFDNTRDKKISLACAFLCIYFVLLPFDFVRIGSIGSITRILAILPMVFSILRIRRRLKLKREPIVKWLLFFLLLAIASYPTSIRQSISFEAIKTLFLNIAMIVIVGACHLYNEKEIRLMTYALIVGSWLSVLMVLLFGTSQYGRVTLLFGDAQQDQNYLCGFMLFAFVYHFRIFLKNWKLLHLVLAFFIILAVILTGSRGALVAFVSTVIYCVVSMGKEKKHKLRTLIIAIAGIIVITFTIYQFIMPRLDTMLYTRYSIEYLLEKGTTGRVDIWKYLLEVYRESELYRQFFGYGYGTTTLVNNMGGVMGGKVAHNLYIDNLITLGILGMIATIGLHVSCIRTGTKKTAYFTSVMIGYIVMCLSVSITSYKPLWSTILMLIVFRNKKELEVDYV